MNNKRPTLNEKFKSKPWLKHKFLASRRCKEHKNYIYKNIKYIMSDEEIKKLWVICSAYRMERPTLHRIDNDSNYTYENCKFMEYEDHKSLHLKLRQSRWERLW